MNPRIAQLKARHPDHEGPLGCSWWRLVRDAYRGTGGFRTAVERARTDESASGDLVVSPLQPIAGSYLRRFGRETAEAFAERQRVSFYRNHIRTIVAQYQGHLWRRAPQASTTIATVASWWENTDGAGTTVARWRAQGSRRAQLFGWCAAYFDRPAEAQSLASARTSARWLQPEELVDWELDGDGSFVWARLCTVTTRRDPFSGAAVKSEHYTTWTRTAFEVAIVEGDELTTSGPVEHKLGAVPIALLYWQPPEEPGDLYGTSHIDSAVAAALELFNVSSEAREVERGSAFPILYMQTRTPGTLAGLRLGTNNGIEVEPDVSMAPGFIAAPSEISAHYAERRAELRDEIYQSANVDPPSAEAAAPESGIARAYKFLPRRSVLVDACEQLATFDRRCVEILARWDGATTPEQIAAWQAATVVTYPSDFDVQDTSTALDQGTTALGVLAPDLAPISVKASRLSVGRALNPQASAADDKALVEQVELLYQSDVKRLGAPQAPTVELNSSNTPWAKGNEIRAMMGLSPVPEGEVIPALEELKTKAAAAAGVPAPTNPSPDPARSGARDPAQASGGGTAAGA
jgi:hypothetical protein